MNLRLRAISALLAATALCTPFAHAQAEVYQYQKFMPGLPSEVPAGGASPSIINFGEVQIPGVSPWQTVSYANLGSSDLTLGGVVAPAGFEVQNDCPGTLVAKQTCALQVRFVPDAPGVFAGTLSIASNSYTSPDLVALTAVATLPVASFVPGSINLGEVEVGVPSEAVSLGASNTGTGVLQLSGLTFAGSEQGFTVTEGTCGPLPKRLGSQDACAMTVSVTPNAQGPLSGTVHVVANDAAGTHEIPLQATGVQATLALTPSSLVFGDVVAGTVSGPQTLTVANQGTANLRIATITRTGANLDEFTVANTCGNPVPPGETCAITVTSAPVSKGAKSASVEIVSNAPTSPTVALLSANAIQGEAGIAPGSWDFSTVVVGQ